MKHINLVMAHMYYLKYFIPLILEANKMGIVSNMYTFHHGENTLSKYKRLKNHPYNYLKDLNKMSKKYDFNFEFLNSNDVNKIEGVTFFVEKRGLSHFVNNGKTFKVVLTCMLEFANRNWYSKYIDKVDKVIFPSKFMAENYKSISSKNLYLGSPKYDINFDKDAIKRKYNINTDKNVLVLVPELNTLNKSKLPILYNILKKKGYAIIVKGRQKQPAPKDLRGDFYFDDGEWFPHPTMELIEISDLVVHFDSGVAKECVMASTPYINIHVTEKWLPYKYFFKYGFCKNLGSDDVKGVVSFIDSLHNNDFEEGFENCRAKYLFEKKNVSRRILETLNV